MSKNGKACNIPIRRVALHDPSQMPTDYSTTPGGTLFSTTPGGTRIIYERKFLLGLRESPLAKSPPANLPDIPGVTSPTKQNLPNIKENSVEDRKPMSEGSTNDTLFEMDM